jgi:diadenosine tetraphosphatase ApaH/serine/threonine PP2A family protein phosphatase
VIVGNVLIDTLTPGAQVREVISAMQVHPLWDGSVFNGYDYALFQIEPVTEPGLVPVPLNFASCNPTDGETLTVMGFGLTSTGGVPSEELLEVNLSYVPNDVCQQPFAQEVVISGTMMCADERVGEPVKAHCSGASS